MEQIINAINEATAAYLTTNGIRANVHGIAEPAIINEANGEEQIRPAIIDERGEIDCDLFDDRYPVCFYHRLNGKTYTGATNGGYGDTIAYTEESDMSMLVYGVRSVIPACRLEENITHTIQSLQYKQGGTSAYCVVKSVSFDRKQVFLGEYSGIPFFLQPNIFLFRINYKIITARRTCN